MVLGVTCRTDQLRVVVADDHPLMRSGVVDRLEREPDISVVGEASDGEDAIRLVNRLRPHVLLLDVEMPVLGGRDVARKLSDQGSSVRVLAFSAHDDRVFVSAMAASGAHGYLLKGDAPELIVDAVRGVGRGERGWFSRSVADRLAAWECADHPGPGRLTPREKQALRLAVDGLSNAEIAAELGVSCKTVEKHLHATFGKLGVQTRVEAAVLAVRERLV